MQSLTRAKISIIIRTLNEGEHLQELIEAILGQRIFEPPEIVVVDSGSTDDTLRIAEQFNCTVCHIEKSNFSFGRALNLGCAVARGELLVFVSGHCIPCNDNWLHELTSPLQEGGLKYSYGRQIGRATTKFSETQIFEKYFPDNDVNQTAEIFVNNANAALLKSAWERFQFDEDLTGLEDMDLAKRLLAHGGETVYCRRACVFHIHSESWTQTRHRYEREAVALQQIMPEVHVSAFDATRYFIAGILNDFVAAFSQRVFFGECVGIVKFRAAQFLGSYKGNHLHRAASRLRRERYFYPRQR